MSEKNILREQLHDLLDVFEEDVIANKPSKALLPHIKGMPYEDGRIGTKELKKIIDKLSVDKKSEIIVAGLVTGCLQLGNDAGLYLTKEQAKKAFKPFLDIRKKQIQSGKYQEHNLKQKCLGIARATWEEYPYVSVKALATKLYLYFSENNQSVSESTISKTWLPSAEFRPEVRSKRNYEFKLIIPENI